MREDGTPRSPLSTISEVAANWERIRIVISCRDLDPATWASVFHERPMPRLAEGALATEAGPPPGVDEVAALAGDVAE